MSDTASASNQAQNSESKDSRRVIALVDDDRNILTTVSIALQSEGFATRVYSDGEAALKGSVGEPARLGSVRYQNAQNGRDGIAAPTAQGI